MFLGKEKCTEEMELGEERKKWLGIIVFRKIPNCALYIYCTISMNLVIKEDISRLMFISLMCNNLIIDMNMQIIKESTKQKKT